MKVEIDLNDILHDDDYGSETLADSVRRQVVEKITKTIKDGVGSAINTEVSQVINREIAEAVKAQMPTIIDDLLNAEYVQVDRYGDRSKNPTTFRKELVKVIHEQMQYKKPSSGYDSDKNPFTRAVDQVIGESIGAFKTEFKKLVDTAFVQETLKLAVESLKQKFGIPTK